VQKQTHHTLTRVLKTGGKNGFLHIGLELRDLFKSQSCPKKGHKLNAQLFHQSASEMRQLLRLNKQKAIEVPADPARVSEEQDIHLDQPGSGNHK
jgi:hypothetical protein